MSQSNRSEGSNTSAEIELAHLMSDSSEDLPDDMHMGIKVRPDDFIRAASSSNPVSSKGTERSASTVPFRQQDIRKPKSPIQEFQDSKSMRDAVYKQWLAEKRAKLKVKRIEEVKSNSSLLKEAADANVKKEQLKADTLRAYQTWKARKDKDLVERIKQKKKEKEKDEEQAIRHKQKQQEAEEAITIWKKKKDEKFKSHLVSKSKDQEDEKQKLQQEAEKKAICKRAFDKWVENKSKALSEAQQHQKSDDKEKNADRQRSQNQAKAFEEWKRRKDEQTKSEKSTKKVEEKLHKQPWRPARAIKYDYLKSPQTLTNERSKRINESSISTTSSTSSLSSSQSLHSPIEPRLKSVKVCCQTLEYWCICKN